MLDGFMIERDGRLYSDNDSFSSAMLEPELQNNGAVRNIMSFKSHDGAMEVTDSVVTHPGLGIVEKWIDVKNTSASDIKVTRVDSIRGLIPAGNYRLKYFTCTHGKEFTPAETTLAGTKILETTGGRSSEGTHPWFALVGQDGSTLACSIAWSGNWIARFEPEHEGSYRITVGLSNWKFSKVLKPGASMEGIHVIYTFLPHGDLDLAAVEFQRWGRKYWYPRNALAQTSPLEFNSWYPYTDRYIHEDVFKANVDRCKELGVEVCTLDAGWFGPSEQESEWYYIRGDWNKINLARFPSGIKALADYVHAKGMKFGIWCEIEAAGPKAELNDIHPELIARRDGGHLGYVCLGNPDAVLWAFGVLEVLIADYGADWLKIDFNISPGAGCNRTDHGHGNGDGLYEHYHGYYKLLDMVCEKYPHVLLENCSGGGLRIDLGIMKHMHLSFLSDPDYPPHAFQVFWGATAMLHPSACLHWAWSQTTSDHKKNGVNNPITNDMPQYKFDYIIRNALLKSPGFSHKFNEYPQWCLDRLVHHFKFYKDVLRDFIRQSDCIRLTEQTLRSGDGDKWSSFLYLAEDKRHAVVFVFRLPGAEPERQLKLKGLDLKLNYRLDFQDKDTSYVKTSFELMNDGILIAGMEEESSEVILLSQTD